MARQNLPLSKESNCVARIAFMEGQDIKIGYYGDNVVEIP